MAENNMPTGYELSRAWFDFCFENPELVNPNHTAIYFFAIEHCNRMGWKEKFGFPTQMTMDALGIKKHNTYIKYFKELCDWGFIKLVQKSANQYSANIISLTSAKPKNGKALDKAIRKHEVKQTEKQPESNGQSNSSIDKPITLEPITYNLEQEFGEEEEKKVDVFLIPSMCQVWYSKFTHYTKNQQNDFPAMRKILQFMTSQAGQTNINDPTVKETILNTLEQITNEVAKDSFWLNKPINSIANNIQEFYNKIKNPQNGSHKQPPSSKQAANQQSLDILLTSIGNDMERIRNEDNRA